MSLLGENTGWQIANRGLGTKARRRGKHFFSSNLHIAFTGFQSSKIELNSVKFRITQEGDKMKFRFILMILDFVE